MPIALSVYCDGGSRGNPGPTASAFIVLDENDNLIHQDGLYLGVTTNNQAEYQAVIEALKWLSTSAYCLLPIHFYLDSLLVVNQIKGIYKINDQNLLLKYLEIKKLLGICNLEFGIFSHVPRALNSRADALVNSTLDISSV